MIGAWNKKIYGKVKHCDKGNWTNEMLLTTDWRLERQSETYDKEIMGDMGLQRNS